MTTSKNSKHISHHSCHRAIVDIDHVARIFTYPMLDIMSAACTIACSSNFNQQPEFTDEELYISAAFLAILIILKGVSYQHTERHQHPVANALYDFFEQGINTAGALYGLAVVSIPSLGKHSYISPFEQYAFPTMTAVWAITSGLNSYYDQSEHRAKRYFSLLACFISPLIATLSAGCTIATAASRYTKPEFTIDEIVGFSAVYCLIVALSLSQFKQCKPLYLGPTLTLANKALDAAGATCGLGVASIPLLNKTNSLTPTWIGVCSLCTLLISSFASLAKHDEIHQRIKKQRPSSDAFFTLLDDEDSQDERQGTACEQTGTLEADPNSSV